MVFKRGYKSLADTLLHIKQQVRDSMAYAHAHVPEVETPHDLFKWLKQRCIYKRDPGDTELLLTMQTMMSGKRTGTRGAGDCDDFTITALASLITSGFKDVKVVLVGRSLSHPVHIYVAVKYKNRLIPFDLTNQYIGQERHTYKYKQVLDFGL